MKRILVIGCPGAGKSYFSSRLSKKINIPVIHMDNLYWNKDKTSITTEELKEKIIPLLEQDEWIFDGNYHKTLELRLARATDVFFLDFPRDDCVNGIMERIGQKRDDIPWIETLDDAKELIEWTENYKKMTREIEMSLLLTYTHVNVHILRSREDVNNYLETLFVNNCHNEWQ